MLHDLHGQRRRVGRDDRAREAALVAVGEELVPDVGAPGAVLAHAVVVGERVAEEVGAVDAALDRGRLVLVAASSAGRPRRWGSRRSRPARTRPTRSARSTPRPTCRRPRARRTRRTARRCRCGRRTGSSRAGCRRPTAAGAASGAASGRRCAAACSRTRCLQPANGSSTNMRAIAAIASSHISRLRVRSTRKPPSSAAEDDSPVPNSTPPVRDQVERGDPLRHPRRVVDRRRDLDDPVAEPDALGARPPRRPGTPRAPTSASTPRGSGARPPRRSRTRAGRRARPAPARPSAARARSAAAPRAAGSGARRRSRSAFRARFSQAAGRFARCSRGGARKGSRRCAKSRSGRVGARSAAARRRRRRGRARPRGGARGGRRGGARGDRRGLALGEPLGARARPHCGRSSTSASSGPEEERYPATEIYLLHEDRNAERLILEGRAYFNSVDSPGIDEVSAKRLQLARQGVRGRRADPRRGRGLGRGLRDHGAGPAALPRRRRALPRDRRRASWRWRSGGPSCSRAFAAGLRGPADRAGQPARARGAPAARGGPRRRSQRPAGGAALRRRRAEGDQRRRPGTTPATARSSASRRPSWRRRPARPGNLVGRLSGDEFCVVMEGATLEQARELAGATLASLKGRHPDLLRRRGARTRASTTSPS